MPVRTFRPITEESFDYDMCEIAAGDPRADGRRAPPALPEQNEHAGQQDRSREGNEHYANADAWIFARLPNRSL